ncbi:MAG: hypothetical protein GC192_24435 [Bacteroidetes bacterium]|nr:hypothetical protein [Bacteroidota bacterium]
MIDHTTFTTKVSNGWHIRTSFGNLIQYDFQENKEDFYTENQLESFHFRLLQYYKDFQGFPLIGDEIVDDNGLFKIHRRTIDIKDKVIEFRLIVLFDAAPE